MKRRTLVIGTCLLLAAVAAGVRFGGGYGGPSSAELSTMLDADLAAWDRDLEKVAPFRDHRLRAMAEEAGAPYPALRHQPARRPLSPGPEGLGARSLASFGENRVAASRAGGNLSEAVETATLLIAYGEDAATGAGFDAESQPTVEAGERFLRDLARDQVLKAPALTRSIEFERKRLTRRPEVVEAWRRGLLDSQVLLRLSLENPLIPVNSDWDAPVKRLFGLAGSAPDEDDKLAAWNGIRTAFAPLLAAAAAHDEEGTRRAAAAIREACSAAEGTLFARVASPILVYGDLARDNYEHWLRTREARLFGMLMLRHREEHGAFPEDLEMVRVEEIPRSPHGGIWRLGTDPETRKPAVYLDGGRVYTYQVLAPREGDFHGDRETKPLFSFR
jgi:hypothetical protein